MLRDVQGVEKGHKGGERRGLNVMFQTSVAKCNNAAVAVKAFNIPNQPRMSRLEHCTDHGSVRIARQHVRASGTLHMQTRPSSTMARRRIHLERQGNERYSETISTGRRWKGIGDTTDRFSLRSHLPGSRLSRENLRLVFLRPGPGSAGDWMLS
ncbi:hypothetical protein CONLIGDRAFT_203527 [Coniochaeta ligniaria NRRL 30616]|uniref:Uncharacterized protein n=1 Tax=Coniochaeta ligniaria NRRL 30616 TaxID=1408157 RepID=A0A1J7J2I2_9PEZI|nr:hypothetical protein CONLIGDRAFT_203527 [Coniochaeta ligniaria NRRL 30616]